MNALQVCAWPVEKLIPYARNARTHSAEQVAQIAASIAEFGFVNPVLIGPDNVIIAGHARLLAARKLGMTEVPVIVLDHLTETQRRALVLADNRLALNAGWNEEMLRVELASLEQDDFNLDLIGFSSEELEALLVEPEPEGFEGRTDEDAVPEAPETAVTRPGDLWVLGNHRLLCGDSIRLDAIEKVLGGGLADMVFTDPPYNVNYGATMKDKLRGKTHRKIANDNLGSGFEQFLRDACANVLAVTKGAVYQACAGCARGARENSFGWPTKAHARAPSASRHDRERAARRDLRDGDVADVIRHGSTAASGRTRRGCGRFQERRRSPLQGTA